MKTLFWIGGPSRFETKLLPEWNVVRAEIRPGTFLTWADCVKLCRGEPDAVLAGDSSLPPYLLGVEDFPCPTIFYAVDTHIHSWLPFYGQAFDACLVSLRDHLPLFLPSAYSGILPARLLCPKMKNFPSCRRNGTVCSSEPSIRKQRRCGSVFSNCWASVFP